MPKYEINGCKIVVTRQEESTGLTLCEGLIYMLMNEVKKEKGEEDVNKSKNQRKK